MKIGIYTQPLRFNYGGLLQNWALQTVLQRMGYDVVTIDPSPYIALPCWKKPFSYMKRVLMKLTGQPSVLYRERELNAAYDIKIRNLRPFIAANIKRREFIRISDLRQDEFDVLLAGSDQVWRPRYNRTYGRTIENAFFDFAKCWNVKRVAYAASFGTDDWEYTKEQTRHCAQLAKVFSSISVREMSAVKLCKEYLGVDAVHVLDPTLLLECIDYEKLIEGGLPTKKPNGNLLCYFLDERTDADELIERIAHEKKLIPFKANSRVEEKNAELEEKIQPPVEQWLRNFKEAEFVVTDSFHACVFSIIFEKPFIVLGNSKRGMARYESLLSVFHLTDNLIQSVSEYNSEKTYAISLESMDLLADMRSASMDFLRKSIEE